MNVLDKIKAKRRVLDNGLTIFLKQIPNASTVAFSVIVECGSIFETKENNGISHFLEHLVGEEGTIKRKRDRQLYKIEVTGAKDWEADVEHQYTNFTLKSLKRFWSQNLKRFLNLISKLYFSQNDLEIERSVILEEIKERQIGSGVFEEEFRKKVFKEGPLSFDIAGTKKVIASLTSKDIKKWHKLFYQPQRMTLIVVGDVKLSSIIRAVNISGIKDLENNNKIISLPSYDTCLEYGTTIETNVYDFNQTRILFPMPNLKTLEDIKEGYAHYLITCIFDDISTLSLANKLRKSAGIYGGYENADYINEYFSYFEVDLTANSQKDLKKMERIFFSWLNNMLDKGVPCDVFKRLYRRRTMQIEEHKVRDCGWWLGLLQHAAREKYLSNLNIYRDPIYIDKAYIEKIFRKHFSKYIILRNIVKK